METVRKRSISKEKLQPIIIIATLFLACLIFTIINPKFASASNIHSIFLTSVTVGIIAVGECCCIIAGYFDMSVSMVGAMSGLAAAFVIRATGSVMLSLVAGLCVGAVCGLAAGVLVACFKMNAFITTYALQSIYRGIIYILTNGIAISMTNSEYARLTRLGQMRVFGAIQFPIIVMIVVYVLGMLFLRYRRLGRSIYLVGGNSKCAQISGINLTMVRIVIFVLCDVLAALAGILFACRVATAQAFLADMIPMEAIAACVVGGVSMMGGKGKLGLTFIGVLLIYVIKNGLIMVGLPDFYQYIATGLILFLAVLAQVERKK